MTSQKLALIEAKKMKQLHNEIPKLQLLSSEPTKRKLMWKIKQIKGSYIKYVGGRGGGWSAGFCGGHEIFKAYIDGPRNVFQNF